MRTKSGSRPNAGATEADRLVVRGDTAYYQGLLLAREQGGSSDRIRQSLPVFKEALALYREARHRYGESRALAALAAAHDDLSSFAEARQLLTAAIEIQTADGDRAGLSRSLQELAWQTLNEGELSKAVDIGRRAISVSVDAGLRDNEADSRNTVGWTLHQLADDAQAEAELRHAVELFQAVRDPLGEGRARNNLGQVRDAQGDMREAIVESERAIELYRVARSPESEAQSLINLGHIYMRSGDPDRAVSSYLQANAIAERTKDRYLQASSLFSIGVAYGNRGDQNRDLELTLEAREIFREMGNRLWEAFTDRSIGRTYHHLGRFQEALAQYEQATTTLRALENRGSEAATFLYVGQVYEDLGETAKAEEWYRKVLDGSDSTGRRRDVHDALIRLSALAVISHDYERARQSLSEALTLTRLTNGSISEADALLVLGDLERETDRPEQAFANYTQARTLYSSAGITGRVAIAALRLGMAAERTSSSAEVSALYAEALQLAREAKAPVVEGLALSRLMAIDATTRPELAVFYGKQAVNVFQRLRGNIATLERETQRTFVQTKAGSYRSLAELLITLGRLAEARQVLDLLKDEEYFEFVRRDRSQSDPLDGRAELTPEEAEWERRYMEIGDRIAAIGQERGVLVAKKFRSPAEEERLTALDADLQVAGQAFQAFLDRLSIEASSHHADQARVQSVRDAQGLMETLRELGPGVVALYTIAGADKYRVILITPDVQKAAEYPISAAELNAKIFKFRENLEDPRRDPLPSAQDLYKVLLGPIERDLAAAKATTLVWSLDSTLRYVPIAALHDGQRYVVQRYRNVMITPASNSRLKDRPRAEWSVLGLAVSKAHENFPPLPGAVRELQEIIRGASGSGSRGVLDGMAIVDDAFTQESMTAALRRGYPVVHIASHFSFQPGNEAASFLLLGDGRRLPLAELKNYQNLFSGVDLLTLSACNTASGGPGAGRTRVRGIRRDCAASRGEGGRRHPVAGGRRQYAAADAHPVHAPRSQSRGVQGGRTAICTGRTARGERLRQYRSNPARTRVAGENQRLGRAPLCPPGPLGALRADRQLALGEVVEALFRWSQVRGEASTTCRTCPAASRNGWRTASSPSS